MEELVEPNLPLGYIKVVRLGDKHIKITRNKTGEQNFYCEIHGENLEISETHMSTIRNGVLKFFKPCSSDSPSIKVKSKEYENFIEYYISHNSVFLVLKFRKLYHSDYVPDYTVINKEDIPSDATYVDIME